MTCLSESHTDKKKQNNKMPKISQTLDKHVEMHLRNKLLDLTSVSTHADFQCHIFRLQLCAFEQSSACGC